LQLIAIKLYCFTSLRRVRGIGNFLVQCLRENWNINIGMRNNLYFPGTTSEFGTFFLGTDVPVGFRRVAKLVARAKRREMDMMMEEVTVRNFISQEISD
jgi:hypothetical protein